MDRRALEDALLDAPALAQLVVVNLHHHAEALYEEDTAEDRQHQLLVDDDGTHGDDTADGQRTRVAHEHLGRVGVVPEKTDERSDEGAEEYHQFLRTRDIHDVEVGGKLDVRRHIRKYA